MKLQFRDYGFDSSKSIGYGTVEFIFEELIGKSNTVSQVVSMKVSVQMSAEATVGQLRDAVYEAGLDRLRHISEMASGKTYDALRAECSGDESYQAGEESFYEGP